MTTAEYAVGTVAACGFACTLLLLLTSWRTLLMEIFLKMFDLRLGWIFRIPM